MTPRRARRPIKHQPATIRLSVAASATARSGSAPASGAIAVPAINAMVDSGPTESTREEPIAAYTTSAASAVHSPVTGGTPTSAV